MNNFLQQILSLFGNTGDNSTLNNAINTSQQPESFEDYKKRKYGYGLREDGTQKGFGYFGAMPMEDGEHNVFGELSLTGTLDDTGKEYLYPSVVPGLTREELDIMSKGGEFTDSIHKKASDFAMQRLREGKPLFATQEEEGMTPIPEFLKKQE